MPNFVPLAPSPTTEAEQKKGEVYAMTATCRQCSTCVRHTRPKASFFKAEERSLLFALKEACPHERFCSPSKEYVPPTVTIWSEKLGGGGWLSLTFNGKEVAGVFGELSRTLAVAVCVAEESTSAYADRDEVAIRIRKAGWTVRRCGVTPNADAKFEPSLKAKRQPRKKKKKAITA